MWMAGHAGAFGCSCKNLEALNNFYDKLDTNVNVVLNTLDLSAEQNYDFVIATDWSADIGIDMYVFREYIDEVENLRPFGSAFPAPNIKFVFRNQDAIEWKKMGKAGQHLKVTFANGFTLLCWNQGHMISEKDRVQVHELSGHLDVSEFKGEETINFIGTFEVND